MRKSKRSEIKTRFLDAYSGNGMIIAQACKTAGIDRQTFYNWTTPGATNKKYDPDFARAVTEIDESFNDLAEHQIVTRVEKGEWVATKYWLECRAPHRWKTQDGPIPVELTGQSTLRVQLTKVIDDVQSSS